MPPVTEISFDLELDSHHRHFIIPLSVGLDAVLEMLPLPQQRRSAISRRALERVTEQALIRPISAGTHALRDLRIKGHEVPELQVRVSGAPDIAEVDGVLGLDFFANFTDVRWTPGINTVILVLPDAT